MKPFQTEITTRKVLDALDKYGLSTEDQRKLLVEMLEEGTDTHRRLVVEGGSIRSVTKMEDGKLALSVRVKSEGTAHRPETAALLAHNHGAGAVVALSPGEEFMHNIDSDVTDFIRSRQAVLLNSGRRPIYADEMKALRACVNALEEKYSATPAQSRYVAEYFNTHMQSYSMEAAHERSLCMAWARAAELLPNIREMMAEFERRIALIYWPPAVTNAATMEALLMAVTYCWSTFEAPDLVTWVHGDPTLIGNLLGELASNGNKPVAMFSNKIGLISNVNDLDEFGLLWLDSNFAKLEIGHKLAASLCLTDVPDDLEVNAPWPAWSFVIPDGLLSPHDSEGAEDFSRVLCEGTKIKYLISSKGKCLGPISQDQSGAPPNVVAVFKLLNSLIKGACLALSDPDQYKKKSLSSNEGSFKSKRVGGAPELNNARYMLSAPVQVDLRDVVHAVHRGDARRGGKLTVQFLVRGHWKNQAHGPQHSMRKRIWLQPFWKGNEETRILLRNYIVKDEEQSNAEYQGLGRGGASEVVSEGRSGDDTSEGGKDGKADV